MSHKLGCVQEFTTSWGYKFKSIVDECWYCGKQESHPLPNPVKDAPIGSLIYYDEDGVFHYTDPNDFSFYKEFGI